MREFMKRVFVRLRGVLGLGLVGAGVGFAGGALGDLLLRLIELGFSVAPGYWGLIFDRVIAAAAQWSLLGGFTGVGFGVMLAAGGKQSLRELPLWRMGAFGVIAGCLFLPAFVVVRSGMGALLDPSLLPFLGISGVIGGALSTSLVALAKRAERGELATIDEALAIPSPD